MPATAAIENHDRRYNMMQEARQVWDQDIQDIVELICPFADDVTTRHAEGSSRTEQLFDMTGVLANDELAASLLGDMSSPSVEWYRFGFRDPQLASDYQVKEWLGVAGEIQLRAYGASNFYESVQQFHKIRQAFGTAAMFVSDMPSGIDPRIRNLRFRNLAYGTYCIAENAWGMVDTLYHTRMLTPRQAVQRYRYVPDIIRRNYGNPQKIDVPMPFVQCVYPREDYNRGKANNTNMPFASITYVEETKEQVEETGFHEFPFVVSRWETMGSSPWGYGLGHLALPEVRTLNKLRELNLLHLALCVLPPLQAIKEGVIGNISLDSLAVNFVTQPNAITPIQFMGRPDLIQIDQAELRASIKSIFFNDVLSAVPPPDASQMTAYEVAQRVEQRVRRIGPAFHRLTSEMFDRLADRVFGLLWRAKQIPPPPMQVVMAAQQNAGQIDVEYTGVLARAQKGADMRAMHELIAFTGSIVAGTQDPSLWDVLLLPDMVRHFATVNNVPDHLIRDALMVKKMQEMRSQQQQQLLAAGEQRENIAAVSKVAPLVQAMRQPQQRAA